MGLTRRAAIIQNWDLQLIANFLSELDHIAGRWPMKGGQFAIPPRIGFADVAQMPADHWSGRYHRSAINVPRRA
jgi:hypothetical protein